MRNEVRRDIMALGHEFNKRWWNYRQMLLHSGWGYVTKRESVLAGHAVKMDKSRVVEFIHGATFSRDSALRVAAAMRNSCDNLLTIRLSVAVLGFDVIVFLPVDNGRAVTDHVISTANGAIGAMTITELSLTLADMELRADTEMERQEFAKARKVSAMGLALLRKGVEIEMKLSHMLVRRSRITGTLIDAAFNDGDSDAKEFSNTMVRSVLDAQADFDMAMELFSDMSLN